MNTIDREISGALYKEICDETVGWTIGTVAHCAMIILVLSTSLTYSILIGGKKELL